MSSNHPNQSLTHLGRETVHRCIACAFCACLALSNIAAAATPNPLVQAKNMLTGGDTAAATKLLERWLLKHPGDVEVTLLLASIFQSQNPRKSGEVLTVALQAAGDRVDLLRALVSAEESMGRARNLVDALRRLRALLPKDEALLLKLVDAYDLADEPAESAAALDAYLAERPQDASSWSRLAIRREHLGHVVDAIRAREAIKILQSRDVANRLALGELYIRLGRDIEAIASFEAVLEIESTNVVALERLAQLYGWNTMPKRRIAALQTLRGLVPRNTDVLRALAEAYSEMERYDLAAEQLDSVLVVEPNDVPTRVVAARYHSWSNNDGASISHLETIVQQEPGNALARQLLATLLRSRGDRREALFHYQQLQAAGQADIKAKEAIQELELETLSRVSAQYEFYIDRNGQIAHRGASWFESSPHDIWRYRAGYRFTYNAGVSLQFRDQDLELPGHGGFIGSQLRLAPRSYLDAEVWVAAVEDVDPFVGFRLGWVQRAQFPLEFRLFFHRRQDNSTIDSLFYDTVVYELTAELQVEPVDLWLFEADAGYGRWINDSVRDGSTQFNNGFTWRVGTGVRILEEPLTLELLLDYDGIAFQVFARSLPYFAPETYQRLGGTVYLNHRPHWRFEYSLFARPNWVVEDNAMQVVYGADAKVFVARRHWLELSFVRTDTPLGTTTVVYRENVVRFTWLSAF
ncbi:MAG: hypothetical protein VX223_17525 [Myxococcota bacterium]|nr:hypothetical protein [Myxococcota bacterium]